MQQNQSQQAKIDLDTDTINVMLYERMRATSCLQLVQTIKIPMDKLSFTYVRPCSTNSPFIAFVAKNCDKNGEFVRYLRLFKFERNDEIRAFTRHFDTKYVGIKAVDTLSPPLHYATDALDKQLYVNNDYHSAPLTRNKHYGNNEPTRRKLSRISFNIKSQKLPTLPTNYHSQYDNEVWWNLAPLMTTLNYIYNVITDVNIFTPTTIATNNLLAQEGIKPWKVTICLYLFLNK